MLASNSAYSWIVLGLEVLVVHVDGARPRLGLELGNGRLTAVRRSPPAKSGAFFWSELG